MLAHYIRFQLIALLISLFLILLAGPVVARHNLEVFEDGSGRYADGSTFCVAGRICDEGK